MEIASKYQNIIGKAGRRAAVLGGMMLAAVTTFAATPPNQGIDRLTITEMDMTWIKVIAWCMIAIVGLLAWITLVVSVKDSSKISFQTLIDEFTSKNMADPEMHHEYDGIRELDNPMPAWLKMFFYATIVFAVVYMFHYQFLGTGPTPEEEYLAEVRLAETLYKDVELPEDAIKLVTDEVALTVAKGRFEEYCTPCHLSDMGGDVGPNLVDNYWIHGGSIKDLYRTISNGVPEKGMISWKKQLTSKERLGVASYILSMQGTKPANPKDPQGELWTEGDTSEKITGEDGSEEETNEEAGEENAGEEMIEEPSDEGPSEELPDGDQ